MHLDPVAVNATRLPMASSFVQGKVEGYVSIQDFDLHCFLNNSRTKWNKDCFSHGQFYLACARVATGKNLYNLASNAKTKNILYQTVLQ